MPPRMEVLLATYNGERYLREQIDSILAQEPAVPVLARDDGSSDGTAEILREYAARFPERFRIVCGDGGPTGSAKGNFEKLLAASTAEYMFFSDQDDVWLPGKISASLQVMQALQPRHGSAPPLLVFSDLRVVDAELRTLHPSFWKHEGIGLPGALRLNRLLVQSVATGCTMMLNRALVVLCVPMPAETPMHDRWAALLAGALGAASALPQATVLYRQHERNVIGARQADASMSALAQRARVQDGRVAQWRISQQMAAALLRLHGAQMPATQREVLQAFLLCGSSRSRWTRVTTMLRWRFFRGSWLRNLATLWMLWSTAPDND